MLVPIMFQKNKNKQKAHNKNTCPPGMMMIVMMNNDQKTDHLWFVFLILIFVQRWLSTVVPKVPI